MPIEPKPDAALSDPRGVAVIENELPAYRAISPGAVVALVLGILSALCFTSWWFLTVAALAIVVGFLAERKIQRRPDALTGRGFAQAGIALGLVFGLTAVTTSVVRDYLRGNQAKVFAEQYREVLKTRPVEDAMFLSQPPSVRKTMDPVAMIAQMKKSGPDGRAMEQQFGSLLALKKQLDAEGSDIHFERIEGVGDDGRTIFAAALFEVHAPNGQAPLPKEGFALALLKGVKFEGKYGWYVEEVKYPYKPDTFTPPVAPVDDGHGHAH